MPDLPPPVPRKRVRKPENRPSSHARGYDRQHKARRAVYLALHPLCEICGVAWANELHHIDGNPRNNDPSNFMALCKPDHSKITRRQQLGLS